MRIGLGKPTAAPNQVLAPRGSTSLSKLPPPKICGSHVVHEVRLLTPNWAVRHQANLKSGLHGSPRLGRAEVDLRTEDSERLLAQRADRLLFHFAVKVAGSPPYDQPFYA
jgi:hypothetical protein